MPARLKTPKASLQTAHGTPTKATATFNRTARGLKKPGPHLAELLELVELVPPDTPEEKLPESLVSSSWVPMDKLLKALSELPAALRAHLLEIVTRPDKWITDPADLLAQLNSDPELERMVRDAWYEGQTELSNLELARIACQVDSVRFFYDMIRNARQAFRDIARGRFFPRTLSTTVLLDLDAKKRGVVMFEPFVAAIRGERLDYIRECPICKRIFFAGRENSDACPGAHADTLRKRRKRESDRLKREMAQKAKQRTKAKTR